MKFSSALVAMAAAVNAHMIMRTPAPAGNPNSSPLSAAGDDYPCKGVTDVSSGPDNIMNVGESQTLSFTGSATHGGGSCQLSMAQGHTVGKDTKFMVIHSIEGGCPFDSAGNLGDDPASTGANTYQFTVPDHPDLPAGDYTLAWTWNNRIGNREFYMNCAKVTLQGAKKKRYMPTTQAISKRQQAPLPDMFVANIGNGCSTPEGIDVEYPNPGASLQLSANPKLGKPAGNCGASGSSSPGPGTNPAPKPDNPSNPGIPTNAGNPGIPTNAPTGFASAPTPVNTIAPTTTGRGRPDRPKITQTDGGNFATIPASSVAAEPTSAASSAASAPSPPVATGTAPDPGSNNAVNAPGSPCSNEGDWACAADGKSFQRCASLRWSPSIQMAAGTTCSPGESANFAYNASGNKVKRDLRSHIARRHGNLYGSLLS